MIEQNFLNAIFFLHHVQYLGFFLHFLFLTLMYFHGLQQRFLTAIFS